MNDTASNIPVVLALSGSEDFGYGALVDAADTGSPSSVAVTATA